MWGNHLAFFVSNYSSNLRLCKSTIYKRVGETTLPNSPKTQNCNLAVYKLGVLIRHGGLVGGDHTHTESCEMERYPILGLTQEMPKLVWLFCRRNAKNP
jgi:hypothetical protein